MTVPAEEQTVDRYCKQLAGDRCDAFNDQRAQRVSSWKREWLTFIRRAELQMIDEVIVKLCIL